MMTINRRYLLAGTAALAGLSLGAGSALAQDMTALNEAPAHGEMTMGSDAAKVTLIEYASASCPHCATFAKETLPTLKKDYIDTGKVKFVFREFPHNDAALAAFMVARCAPKEKYFPLIDAFFATQEEWLKDPMGGLAKIAQQAGMTKEAFDACLKNEPVARQILDVRKKAEGFGVESIPTFFINGTKLKGESSIEEMKKAIDPLLG